MRRVAHVSGFAAIALLLPANPLPGQETFTPIIGWENQLFPSYVLAIATMHSAPLEENSDPTATKTLGAPYGVIGVEVRAPADNTAINVTVECPEIMDRSTFQGVMPTRGRSYAIYPRVRYRYGVLARNKQATPLSITFTVSMMHGRTEEFTATATLRSVNDCPFATIENDGHTADLSFMFAAYVNEQHPFVDQVLREALDEGVVESFTGYHGEDRADVVRQVFAIWNALSQRDVRYSSITKSVVDDDTVYSQHVRFIDESINNRQANCLDGSVLLASILRKIGIDTVLVSLPRHVYVAFYLDKDHSKLIGLETTMIGDHLNPDDEIPPLNNVFYEKWAKTNSWRTFCSAVGVGTADLEENDDKFNKDDPDYQLISIAEARDAGILPIGFDASSKFKERPVEAK